jgi:hypothetical protein
MKNRNPSVPPKPPSIPTDLAPPASPADDEAPGAGESSKPAPGLAIESSQPPQKETKAEPPAERDLSKFADHFFLISDEEEPMQRREICKHIRKLLSKHGLSDLYTVVMFIDEVDAIGSYHANQIYAVTSANSKQKDVLMILASSGGSIEPGFLLSKTCKRLSANRFVVAVPRKAKSAATLIALGADEIHMGVMSELGPIDPQIGGFPALGVQNSLEVFADLACKYPNSADLFSRYLSNSLDLKHLGYFARVPGSAAQYAERLLSGKELGENQTPFSIGKHFVEHYKDHAFVIDIDEAKSLLGPMVVEDSPEYLAANEIYQFLYMTSRLYRSLKKKEMWYVGSVEAGLSTRELSN